MKIKLLNQLLILFLFSVHCAVGQDLSYSYLTIPKGLTNNANAVVRQSHTDIEVFSPQKMTIRFQKVITVLNKLGNAKVGAVVGYDKNSTIRKLSAKVYNALGIEIKKFSKNKFEDVSAVSGGTMYSDSRVKYLNYTPVSYPYTIQFNYEIQTSSTGFVPNWQPLEEYLVSTENSSYSIQIRDSKLVRTKEVNFKDHKIEKEVTGDRIIYRGSNFMAVKNESHSPPFSSYNPKLLVAINHFTTDGVRGSYTNWNEFGKWMYGSLLQGRGDVSGTTKLKIKALVANAKTPIEKAKIVYNFVQEKTRYISVQVGIGGIQPISAFEVDKVGYGDCKGLTNYTKALLDVVGVTSYYSHVEGNANEQVSFENEFASLEQGNHVILNIPNNGSDVWLECTSQTLPFGFLGSFTDNRNALVITPEGGVIKRTSSYKNEHNLQSNTATIKIDSLGSVSADFNRVSKGIQYDDVYAVENLEKKELLSYYKNTVWGYNNNLSLKKMTFTNDKDRVVFSEKVKVEIDNYGTLISSGILFKVNVFNRNNYIPKRYRKRKLPLKINRGYKDTDSYVIELPKEFNVTSNIEQRKNITSKFGVYSLTITRINKHTLQYERTLFIKEGDYTKEDYKLYRDFRKKIAQNDNLRIAILKQ